MVKTIDEESVITISNQYLESEEQEWQWTGAFATESKDKEEKLKEGIPKRTEVIERIVRWFDAITRDDTMWCQEDESWGFPQIHEYSERIPIIDPRQDEQNENSASLHTNRSISSISRNRACATTQ